MASAVDIKLVEAACSAALGELGVAVRRSIGRLPLNHVADGWIGLNRGVHADFVRIHPNIGVHCPALMKLKAQASGKKYDAGIATYSIPLRTLCPDQPQFLFDVSTDFAAEANRLATLLSQHGLSYMRSIASYAALLPLLKERVPNLGGFPQSYAAALLLNGDSTGASAFIATFNDSSEVAAELQKMQALFQ